MASPESLLLRLNIASPGMVGGGGAFGSLTRQDISAALGMGGLADHLYWLAQVMYCDDNSNRSRLAKVAWFEFAQVAKSQGWQRSHYQRGRQLFRACAVVALFEFLGEAGRRCPACQGTGLAPKRKREPAAPGTSAPAAPPAPGNCARCNGWERVDLLPSERLALLNQALRTIGEEMASSSWYEIWHSRYCEALMMVQGWHGDLQRHVRRYTRIEEGAA